MCTILLEPLGRKNTSTTCTNNRPIVTYLLSVIINTILFGNLLLQVMSTDSLYKLMNNSPANLR